MLLDRGPLGDPLPLRLLRVAVTLPAPGHDGQEQASEEQPAGGGHRAAPHRLTGLRREAGHPVERHPRERGTEVRAIQLFEPEFE